jgi:host factor-I protein
MKDGIDAMPVERLAERKPEQDGFANRKLIRPSLSRTDHNHAAVVVGSRGEHTERSERAERGDRGERFGGGGRKASPPEQTNAENFYYQKQMQSRTPMVIVLRNGEEVRGVIEWYDRCCIKVNRTTEPNLMIYKPAIKYMYKEGENSSK